MPHASHGGQLHMYQVDLQLELELDPTTTSRGEVARSARYSKASMQGSRRVMHRRKS